VLPDSPVTTLLTAWRSGDQAAAGQLLALVYPELRRLAAHYLKSERPGHTLQPTALVHELYLRLFAGEPVTWENRAHFFGMAAQTLRHILVDHARARLADKRGGGMLRLSLTAADGWIQPYDEDILELEELLEQLETLAPRVAKVVELRFFGGLEERQVAEVLSVSSITVKRDWKFARAWLISRLRR
jgi:RNA polymerase sigma factor (TIGR02999 family)